MQGLKAVEYLGQSLLQRVVPVSSQTMVLVTITKRAINNSESSSLELPGPSPWRSPSIIREEPAVAPGERRSNYQPA